MMNPQIEAVRAAAAIMRSAFPDGCVSLDVSSFESISVSYFGPKTYAAATEWLRSLGCGQRSKTPHETYTSMRGESDKIEWRCFPDELPPTCRKVTRIERIPKTQTVETGEFIEVTREVIECGRDSDEMEAAYE